MILPYAFFVRISLVVPGAGRVEKTICANCGALTSASICFAYSEFGGDCCELAELAARISDAQIRMICLSIAISSCAFPRTPMLPKLADLSRR